MKISIDIKYLIFLTLGFILSTAIGTVSHELGHVITAKSLGYETTLHYGSANHNDSDLSKKLIEIQNENKAAIANRINFDQKSK